MNSLFSAFWIVSHGASVIVALTVIVLTGYIAWRSGIHRAAKLKLNVQVIRDLSSAKEWEKAGPLLRYLELDTTIAGNAPYKMLSLGQYMASLRPQGNFSLQRAIVYIMETKGLQLALPLALFAPESWRRESNVIGAFAHTPYAALLVSNVISTLGLITVSSLAQRYTVGLKRQALLAAKQNKISSQPNASTPTSAAQTESGTKKAPPPTAIKIMVHGEDPRTDDGVGQRVQSGFRIPQDIAGALILDDVAEDESLMDAPQPSEIHHLFPDLHSGNGGLKRTVSARQAQINAIAAVVCNRLAANSLLGLENIHDGPTKRFVVQIQNPSDNSCTEISTVEDFVAALERCGHAINMYMNSNITSFGVGLCVKETTAEEGSTTWTQIPLAYPLLTGMYARDSGGNESEAATLMAHASLRMEISGPLLRCQLEWCLSISGMTGWLPVNPIYRAWQLDRAACSRHSEGATASSLGRQKASRLTTVAAAMLNVAATHGQLLFGGYGFLGVCLDSVAAIQQAMTGTCSLYPLILGGDAKMRLLDCYHEIALKATKDGKWEYEAEANALRVAIAELPCDGIVDCTDVITTARRALACLPEQSVFAGVNTCRASLLAAIDTAQRVMVS